MDTQDTGQSADPVPAGNTAAPDTGLDGIGGIERGVSEHYGKGGLLERLLGALAGMGYDPERLLPEELSAADQFHVGGIEATDEVAADAKLGQGSRVLDLGCGIGGPARRWASQYGARVHGVDITEEFVDTAVELTRRCGLSHAATFSRASALETGEPDDSFDVATLMHVGMNLPDKAGAFAEAARVLAHGGTMAVYDVVDAQPGGPPLEYPMPWSAKPETSFVEPLEAYTSALEGAGFGIVSTRDRTAEGLAFFDEMESRMSSAAGPPPLGIHLHMGNEAAVYMGHAIAAVRAGRLAPTVIIARLGA